MVKKALKVLNKIELLVIYITFGGMIFAAFAQVIFRLILKSPLAWSEEVCRYCFADLSAATKPHGMKQKNALLHTLLQIARKAVKRQHSNQNFRSALIWKLCPASKSKDSTGSMNCK